MKNKIRDTLFFNMAIYLLYIIKRYILNAYIKPLKLAYNIHCVSVDNKNINFFGYYNLSPENNNGDVIYLEVNDELIRGSKQEKSKIMLINDNKNYFSIINTTHSWNWQQGCMLKWLGNSDNHIIYNDFENNQYVSKIINKKGELIRKYSSAIYSVSKSGKFALTLSFERLAKLRPDYGYFNHKNVDLLPDNKDGIWYIDLESGEKHLIVTLEKLKNLKFVNSMVKAVHKVNHIDINPSSTRFMFLHRWIGPNGRFMRLITADIDGSNLYILNGDKMTSHCCWINDEEIISFCNIDDEGNGYYKFRNNTNRVNFLSKKLPSVDGHPSISPNGEWMITDTYPDRARMSWLLLYNFKENKVIKLGRFYQPLRYKKEIRIDLHPKWSPDGKSIYFESGHSGKRQLNKMDLSNIIK